MKLLKEGNYKPTDELYTMRDRLSEMVATVFGEDDLKLSRESHQKLILVSNAFNELIESL